MALLLAIAGIALVRDDAGAHAAFDRSDPAPNSILAESPEEIRIWFTEPLEFEQSEAVLYDQTGHPVPTNPSEPGEGEFSLLIRLDQPLERGTYSVAWHNLSTADGHPQQGYFAFTVGSQADVTTAVAPEDEDSGPPLWLQSASRWIVLLAISPLIAAWLIWIVVLYPVAREQQALPVLASRVERILTVAFVVALAGNLLALFVQAAILSGGSLISRVGDLLADTRYGQLWIARIVLLQALAVAFKLVDWLNPFRNRAAAVIVLGLSLALPLPVSMNAHAAALGEGRTTAIIFDWTHIVAAGTWFGGLIVLAGALLRPFGSQVATGRRGLLAAALPRFSAVALVCWGQLVLTGVYAAWLHVGSWEALRETDYGRSLMVKLALVGLVLVLAALNLLLVTRRLAATQGEEGSARWRRRLGFAVTAEIVLAVLLLFVVGRMTSLQPARDALAVESSGSSIAFDLEGRTATLVLNPGTAGPNHYQLTIPGDALPDDTEALLRLEYQGENLGIEEMTLERAQGNLFEAHGSELSIAGDWRLEVIVRQIGGFSWTDTADVEITTGAAEARSLPWRFTTHSIAALLLVAIGLIGLVIAWRAGKSKLRTESAALAAIAIILGFGIMATDRVEPATAGIDYSMENPIPATADSIVTGKEIYENLCLSCHGAGGRGDGIAGAALIPPPADFTAGHAQTHADGEWFAWIRDGKPETSMPAFGDSLSDEEIWHVINYIQTEFQGQPVEGSGTPSASPSPAEDEHEGHE